MRARVLLLIGIVFCLHVRSSVALTPQFKQCQTDYDCPSGARCYDQNGQLYNNPPGTSNGRCMCDSGLYPYIGSTRLTVDLGITDPQTVSCRGINSCDQYNRDCGPYGDCVERSGRYYCRCRDGYSGERCDYPGTRRSGISNIVPLIGAGVAALVILGIGGAALASVSG